MTVTDIKQLREHIRNYAKDKNFVRVKRYVDDLNDMGVFYYINIHDKITRITYHNVGIVISGELEKRGKGVYYGLRK